MSEMRNFEKPKLRFNGFFSPWQLKELGEFLSFKNGINAEKEMYGTGYKFINVLDIINNNQITHSCILGAVNVSESVFQKYRVDYGDILFQRSSENRAEAGQSNVYLDAEKSSCFGGFIIRGKPKRAFNSVYMHYLLKSQRARKEITTKSGGSTRYNVGQDTLAEVQIYLSENLHEQQKIADFLSAIDEKIRLLKEKHALLQQYKKGVMQKLFSQEIRFKDDNGQAFPDWKFSHGDKLFSSISDKKHNSDLPILAITQEHGAIPRELINYQVQASEESVASYKVVNEGDFIISLRSFQGGIEYSRYKGICSPAYIILRPCAEMVEDFYRYYLKTGNFIQEMKRRLEGIRDGKILSYKYFSEIRLPYPCVAEQQKIAAFIMALDKKLDAVQQQIDLTQTFKKGLLQQMFV